MVGGGLLFENGKRYVKIGSGHQFKGKIKALPFFFAVLVLGWALQRLTPMVDEMVYSIPGSMRLGIMVMGSMLLFNYSVDYFNYTDMKSLSVYAVGALLIFWPSL